MKINKKVEQYLKEHPESKDEFFDLIDSDPNFNYSEFEISNWIADCVLL